jgi:hypothetical protein
LLSKVQLCLITLRPTQEAEQAGRLFVVYKVQLCIPCVHTIQRWPHKKETWLTPDSKVKETQGSNKTNGVDHWLDYVKERSTLI